MSYHKQIVSYIEKEIEVLRMLDIAAIHAAMDLLDETRLAGKSIYIFGNGGSGATASHFASDFNKGISAFAEKKFNMVCLNDNIPTMMAIANDIGYDEVFRHQLNGRLAAEDIVIAISVSGNSKSVLNAVLYAKACGSKVISMTGYNGGKLKPLADIGLHVPVADMQIAEDVHLMLNHAMMKTFINQLRKDG